MTYQRSFRPIGDKAGTSINLMPRRLSSKGCCDGGNAPDICCGGATSYRRGGRHPLSGLGATGGTSANAAVRSLQAVVNRFSEVGGFSPVAVDGGMGGSTENATQNALVIASGQGFGEELLTGFNAAFSTGAGQSFIMQHVFDITTTLVAVANSMGLPAEIKPSPITTLVSSVTNAITGGPKLPGAAAGSVVDIVKNMPTPMKLALAGITAGIGYFAFFDKPKRRR